jgi:Domain of unknown function (DUF1858)
LWRWAPAFAKLRNPVIRRTIAKVATLEQAAKIGGVSLQAMILRLRNVTGQTAPDLPVAQSRHDEGDDAPWLKAGRAFYRGNRCPSGNGSVP